MSSDFTKVCGTHKTKVQNKHYGARWWSIIHKLLSIFYSKDKTHLDKKHNFHMYEIVKIKISLKTLQNF